MEDGLRAAILADSGNYSEALKLIDRIKEEGSEDISIFYTEGVCSNKLGYTQRAISAYKKFISEKPSDYRALCNLGGIYTIRKDYDKAKFYLEKAMAVNVNDGLTWYFLALVNWDNGHFEYALYCFSTSLELNPNNQISRLEYAYCIYASSVFGLSNKFDIRESLPNVNRSLMHNEFESSSLFIENNKIRLFWV